MTHVLRVEGAIDGEWSCIYSGHGGECNFIPCPSRAVALGTAVVRMDGFVYCATVRGFLGRSGMGQSLSLTSAVQYAVAELDAVTPSSLDELAALLGERGLMDEAENLPHTPTFGERTKWVASVLESGAALVSWDTRSFPQRALVRRTGSVGVEALSTWLEVIESPEWKPTHRLCFTPRGAREMQATQQLDVMLAETVAGEGGPAYQLVELANEKETAWSFSPENGWQWRGLSMSEVGDLEVEIL